ncbi:hypothetical protein GCM10020218_097320 [Dactylosporangium vinaceum]
MPGLRTVLIEARDDVGDGTSKANTAILTHRASTPTPGTLEARLVARGYRLLREYARPPVSRSKRTGALLVAWTPQELATLPALRTRPNATATPTAPFIEHGRCTHRPGLAPGALGGLTVPGGRHLHVDDELPWPRRCQPRR